MSGQFVNILEIFKVIHNFANGIGFVFEIRMGVQKLFEFIFLHNIKNVVFYSLKNVYILIFTGDVGHVESVFVFKVNSEFFLKSVIVFDD